MRAWIEALRGLRASTSLSFANTSNSKNSVNILHGDTLMMDRCGL